MILFIFWIILSFVVGAYANDRKMGFLGGLLLSLILSPVIGFIVVYFSERKNPQTNPDNVITGRKLENSKWGKPVFSRTGWIILIAIALIVFVAILFPNGPNNNNNMPQERPETVAKPKEASISFYGVENRIDSSRTAFEDSIAKASHESRQHIEDSLTEILIKRENKEKIKDFMGQCNISHFENIQDAQDLASAYDRLRTLSEEVWAYRQDSKALGQKYDRLQRRVFPYFRKKFAEITNQKLWIDNGSAEIRGSNSQILRLIAADFASHREIQDSYNAIEPTLEKFRFKEIQFLWYKEDDDYTIYKIDSPADKDEIQ